MATLRVQVTGIPQATAALDRLQQGAVAVGRTVLRVGSPLAYSGYVERGTRRMRARPFLAPALDAAERSLRGRLVAALPRGAQATAAALLGVGAEMKATAQRLAPVRTGNLRSSIYSTTTGRR